MLKSPKDYIQELENKSYNELLLERDKIISSMLYFEANSVEIMKQSLGVIPSPAVEYELSFERLAKVSMLIVRKFNLKDK